MYRCSFKVVASRIHEPKDLGTGTLNESRFNPEDNDDDEQQQRQQSATDQVLMRQRLLVADEQEAEDLWNFNSSQSTSQARPRPWRR